ncbi:MAG: DNA polymerase III subunit gamma/tau [Oscillospiraceae bacterium]|nr:DNA polymerase III subunit gamma/tau [Oscillospiraceae bacterium]
MHLALYRKYRPKTFAEVISQPHITITLQNQIKSGNIAHAYLFTGSRGTGKTTCAKILAKAVNCTDSKDGNPCMECESCKSADKSPDIREIDAASNNGVDDVRVLREEAGYLPSELKYKVYIIDEVHMLSNQAFNALLKTLEEPPSHVIFILATTEVHKILPTVLSRCQRYEFNRINSEESAETLMKIASTEGFTLEKDAALLIARLSDGGMRDALSLLDVAVADNTVITQEIVRDSAGIAGKEHLFAIADAVANKEAGAALSVISGLYAKSKDPTRLIDELLQHFRNLMIIKIMPGDFSLMTVLKEEIPEYNRQAGLFTIGSILNNIDKLEECLRLKGRKVEAEICLMKMCLAEGAEQPVQMIQPVQPVRPPVQPPIQPVQSPIAPPAPPTSPEPPLTVGERKPFAEWQSILVRLAQVDRFKAAMLEESVAGVSSNVIIVQGAETMGFFFENPGNSAILERVVREVTQRDYKVIFEVIEVKQEPQAKPTLEGLSPLQNNLTAAPEIQTESSKIQQFLNDVKSAGVQLQIL